MEDQRQQSPETVSPTSSRMLQKEAKEDITRTVIALNVFKDLSVGMMVDW